MRSLMPLVLVLAISACDDRPIPVDSGDTDVVEVPDVDQDGFNAEQDCDDKNPDINPGAQELCDKVDNNCDKNVDEGYDDDGDGHWSAEQCDFGDDCNDRKGNINPSAEDKPYDGIDQDCSGADLTDVDGDGYDSTEVENGTDCVDDNEDIHPGAIDIPYDAIDQDCVGGDLVDVDRDGHAHADFGGDDCNDDDPKINPSAMDWGNDEIDQDCEGRDGNDAKLKASRALVNIVGTEGVADWLGHQVVVCDYDGDGSDDFIVSAPLAVSYQGEIGIFLSDFSHTWTEEMTLADSDVHIKGGSANTFFGSAVACADIDGDGHDDLVVSSAEIRNGSFDSDWKLFIWYGTKEFVWNTTDRSADAKIEVDFITEETGGNTLFWPSVDIGDLDGDGKGEIVLGFNSGWPTRDKDMVAILPGSDKYADWYGWDDLTMITLEDDTAERNNAMSGVQVVPDMNGDGLADLAVLQPYHTEDADPDSDLVSQGQVSFFSKIESDGGFGELAYSTIIGTGDDHVGSSILVDDFDNDGKVDLLLGASTDGTYQKEGGALYMVSDVSGKLKSKAIDPESIATSGLKGTEEDGWQGSALFAAGDVDGDGATDFFVHEARYDRAATERDAVYTSNDVVHLIGGDHLDGWKRAEDAWLATWSTASDVSRFGSAVTVGDFDDDGAPDFLLSAPRLQTYKAARPSGWVNSGQVYLYRSVDYAWGPSGD
ncbi:MAG: hypothetical protein ACI9MC_001727 [Kiritimatiellia bacterium]|jgi:hypothetical protein